MTTQATLGRLQAPLGNSTEQSGSMAQFDFHIKNSPCRRSLEAYIAEKYRSVHSADISHFMPILLQMSVSGRRQAALGLTPGQYDPLFLEQYLELPAQQHIAALAKGPIDRYSLIEVGNLVVTRRGTGLLLFIVMALSAAGAGYQWLLFTATDEVVKLIRRLGFEPQFLAQADPDRVAGGAQNWGDYYRHCPRVMAGNLNKAVQIGEQSSALRDIVMLYSDQIDLLTQSLCDYRRLVVR